MNPARAESQVPADGPPRRRLPAPAAPVPGRRERKKLETRTALEAAAFRLFGEQGYERTTVEEIAEAADVAVRTFFRYFQSKQDVLFGDVARNVAGRMREALSQRPADEPVVAAVGAALREMALGGGDPDEQEHQILERLRLMERLPELAGAYHVLLQQVHDAIAAYVAARTAQPVTELYPQLVAAAAMGSVKAALCTFEASAGTRSIAELRDEAYRRLAAGLDSPAR